MHSISAAACWDHLCSVVDVSAGFVASGLNRLVVHWSDNSKLQEHSMADTGQGVSSKHVGTCYTPNL